MSSIDDYKRTIPVDDVLDADVLLAARKIYQRNTVIPVLREVMADYTYGNGAESLEDYIKRLIREVE